MVLNIRRILDTEGESLPLKFDLDLSHVERYGQRPLRQPVHIEGTVENRSGVVSLIYNADYHLEAACDRCLAPIARRCSQHFAHTVVEKLYAEDTAEFLISEDGMVDMQELVLTDILLELPIKLLCREDCKGLCPKCGGNLNESDCGCDTRQLDPRLEALRRLLDQSSDA